MNKIINNIGRYALVLTFGLGINNNAIAEKRLDMPNLIYQSRYNEFDNYFDNYSKDNPDDINENKFKALLVSIAQKESSLGFPNGKKKNTFMLMGYGNPKDRKNYGIENQLKLSSNCLKNAFNEENSNYKESFDKEGDKKIKAILSIYNQGEINDEGINYANEVYSDYLKWNNYFEKELKP